MGCATGRESGSGNELVGMLMVMYLDIRQGEERRRRVG
jgi:hypothetical protein